MQPLRLHSAEQESWLMRSDKLEAIGTAHDRDLWAKETTHSISSGLYSGCNGLDGEERESGFMISWCWKEGAGDPAQLWSQDITRMFGFQSLNWFQPKGQCRYHSSSLWAILAPFSPHQPVSASSFHFMNVQISQFIVINLIESLEKTSDRPIISANPVIGS